MKYLILFLFLVAGYTATAQTRQFDTLYIQGGGRIVVSHWLLNADSVNKRIADSASKIAATAVTAYSNQVAGSFATNQSVNVLSNQLASTSSTSGGLRARYEADSVARDAQLASIRSSYVLSSALVNYVQQSAFNALSTLVRADSSRISALQNAGYITQATAVTPGQLTTAITNGNTAFSWGNHALAGYAAGSGLTALQTLVRADSIRINSAAATASNNTSLLNGLSATVTGQGNSIAMNSSAIAAHAATLDSLRAVITGMKVTAATNATAITNLQTAAVQNWKVLFTSRANDSIVIINGTQNNIVPGGYGSLGLTVANIDTTKIYRYTQFFYYTSTSAVTAPTSTIQVHLGTSNYVEIPAGNLAVIALGAVRLGTLTVYVKFKSNGLFFVSGGPKYETATQRLYYEYSILNSPSTQVYNNGNTNFYLTGAVSGGTMVFKDALLEYGTPGNTIQN